MPPVVQVSISSPSLAGKNTSRTLPSSSVQPAAHQALWLMPLANDQRPLQIRPPSAARALPLGRSAPAATASGLL